MTRIAVLNDTHCGIRNSSEIFLDNAEKFYGEVFFPYLIENNITHIIHLGDYYDNRKMISFRALARNRKMFLDKLRKYKITMDVIPGNHDVYYKNTNNLNSLKELLGHYINEVTIIMEPTVMDYSGMKMALIPWINSENYEKTKNFIDNCSADIVGAHLELEGFEMAKGIVAPHGQDKKMFSRFEMVLSGHYHTKSQQDNIYYLGTQMEFFWNDAHDTKYFHILNTETRELKPIANPHTLFHKIYYDDTDNIPHIDIDLNKKFIKVIVIKKNDTYKFDTFIDKIQQHDIYDLKIAENFSEFIGENIVDDQVSLEDTGSLLNSYIDAVNTDLDKDRIKKQVNQLMIEAQTLEIS